MGAGAGYTIEVEDCEFKSMAEIIPSDVVSMEKSGGYCSVTVKTDIKLVATLTGGSYYDSIGNIANVALTVTEVKLSLDFGSGINSEILNASSVEKFEEQFDTDIESLWKELVDVVEIEDLDLDYIKYELNNGRYYEGSASLGGGWIGSTFDGEFEVKDVDSNSGYNDIESYIAFIPSDMVVSFIDEAKYGDNVQYTAYYNREGIESYSTEEEAINALKDYIDGVIAKGNVEDVDFENCDVEREYYFLIDGGEDTYMYETDFDNTEIVYSADTDDYYEEYIEW